MATRIVSYRILECDSCDARFGEEIASASMAEIRARAWQVGWRFPVKGTRNSDYCPTCTTNQTGAGDAREATAQQ